LAGHGYRGARLLPIMEGRAVNPMIEITNIVALLLLAILAH
jgi:Na+/H+-translocating membrane pyrophosphatase